MSHLIGLPPPILTRVTSGSYIMAPFATAYTTLGAAADFLYATPVFVAKGGTVTKIGVEVTTLGSGSVRLGIYAMGASRPGKLVVDAGTVSVGTTGTKEITISQAVTDYTWYWLAMVSDVNFTCISCNVGAWFFNQVSTSSPNTSNHLRRAFTYAALPADESAQTYDQNTGVSMPNLWIRG